jgi:hypothetical protein
MFVTLDYPPQPASWPFYDLAQVLRRVDGTYGATASLLVS